MPNKHVIEHWLRWLRRDARAGDTLFLYRALPISHIASIIIAHLMLFLLQSRVMESRSLI